MTLCSTAPLARAVSQSIRIRVCRRLLLKPACRRWMPTALAPGWGLQVQLGCEADSLIQRHVRHVLNLDNQDTVVPIDTFVRQYNSQGMPEKEELNLYACCLLPAGAPASCCCCCLLECDR